MPIQATVEFIPGMIGQRSLLGYMEKQRKLSQLCLARSTVLLGDWVISLRSISLIQDCHHPREIKAPVSLQLFTPVNMPQKLCTITQGCCLGLISRWIDMETKDFSLFPWIAFILLLLLFLANLGATPSKVIQIKPQSAWASLLHF
jgi:hypothetical protein